MENQTSAAFTVQTFCKAYAVSRSFAYNEIRAGKLVARKAGSRTLILREEADIWAKSLPVGSTGDAA